MTNPENLNPYRIKVGPNPSTDEDGCNGAFLLQIKDNPKLAIQVFSSSRDNWEHLCVVTLERVGLIKVTVTERESNNEEMRLVKNLFFKPDEHAVEFFPAQKSGLHAKPPTRHLWRHSFRDFPMPEIEQPKQDGGLIMLPNGKG